ncbi:MAG TPA: hypothetical protein VFE62_21655 [Gemmataceae bacterium]|nr:hypothetical protein [Gemmataceae bacterium]
MKRTVSDSLMSAMRSQPEKAYAPYETFTKRNILGVRKSRIAPATLAQISHVSDQEHFPLAHYRANYP